MKIIWKKKEIGYKNSCVFMFKNDRFYLIPSLGLMYEHRYDYIRTFDSIAICMGFLFFCIKIEHKYNIRHE